jgi:hypothetical protein
MSPPLAAQQCSVRRKGHGQLQLADNASQVLLCARHAALSFGRDAMLSLDERDTRGGALGAGVPTRTGRHPDQRR